MMIMAGCMLIMCFDRKHKVPKSLINQLPRNILFLFKVRESRKGKIVLEYIFCIPCDIQDETPEQHSHSRTSQPTLNSHHASCSITEDAARLKVAFAATANNDSVGRVMSYLNVGILTTRCFSDNQSFFILATKFPALFFTIPFLYTFLIYMYIFLTFREP